MVFGTMARSEPATTAVAGEIDMPQGVLIIYGPSLIPKYNNERVSEIMISVCRSFAEYVHAELTRNGVPSVVYTAYGDDPLRYVGDQMNRADGLLQVVVTHEKQTDHYDIVLLAELLHLRHAPEHHKIKMSSSPISKRYVLHSTAWAVDESPPIDEIALDFVSHLIAEGGLDRSQGVYEEHIRHYARRNAQRLDLPLPEFWFSFTNKPFVNPRIIQDVQGWESDRGDQVVAVNLIEAQRCNRYFINEIDSGSSEQSRALWGPNPMVSYHEPDSKVYFHYVYIGKTDTGLHVLHTAENTGGSSTLKQLLFFFIEPDMGVSFDWETMKVQRNRPRLLLFLEGRIALGDRWLGELRVDGNELFIGKDDGWFRTRAIGGPFAADPQDRVVTFD